MSDGRADFEESLNGERHGRSSTGSANAADAG
jgi:hypothetical protein